MFIPSDGIYQAALAEDPALIEYGVSQQVLLATPTTLIGLLWAVHYGWRQELIAESAREIADSGRELHRRLGRFVEPLSKLGRQLDSAVGAYNDAVGSFDQRVMPQVRRIEQAGAGSGREVERAGGDRDQRAHDHGASGRRTGSARAGRSRRADGAAGSGCRPLRRRLSATSTSASATGTVAGSSSMVRNSRSNSSASTATSSAAAQLFGEAELARQQAPQRGRDEEVAVAHHRRAEHAALQLRQARHRVGGVERVVRALQQVGGHQRRVGERHQDDPPRQPPGRGDGRQQDAQRDTAEPRQAAAPPPARGGCRGRPRRARTAVSRPAPPSPWRRAQGTPRASAASSGTATSAR